MAASIVDYRQAVNDQQVSFSEALLELTDKEIRLWLDDID